MKPSRRFMALCLPPLMLALAALACTSSTASFTVENNPSFKICELYLNPSSDSGWGENELGGETIAPGEDFTVSDVEAGTYDLRAVPCDETVQDVRNTDVEIDGRFTWELSDEEAHGGSGQCGALRRLSFWRRTVSREP